MRPICENIRAPGAYVRAVRFVDNDLGVVTRKDKHSIAAIDGHGRDVAMKVIV
jgi:hypothetical protein